MRVPGKTPQEQLKHDLFAQVARISKALGSGNRLELLEFLAQGERDVDTLAKAAGFSLANTSHHLQQLRRAGLVHTRREGQHIYYSLAGDDVTRLVIALRQTAERRLAEIDRLIRAYLGHRDELEPIPAKELLTRIRKRTVTVLDVRPREEYEAGHLPGAVNIPVKEIKRRRHQLPHGQEIVAYCRGPYCVLAYDAVQNLRTAGLRARRLQGGFPEWKAAGLPTESAEST
ncbi:MAG: metalloregulator ArsR/SmtB family transcription factor [Gammaproteobacteria bacterium]|nr:metalloregulator ArsR/SmtB family transcription factor [Gammaproteobacteria bacterium]